MPQRSTKLKIVEPFSTYGERRSLQEMLKALPGQEVPEAHKVNLPQNEIASTLHRNRQFINKFTG